MRREIILIGEDNYTNYALLIAYIGDSDYETLWAKNGKEAIDMFIEHPDIDIILMDINMPVMNGDIAAKKIKEINSNIPIIAITAYYRGKFDETYFDGVIQKPIISSSNLMKSINEHINKYRNNT